MSRFSDFLHGLTERVLAVADTMGAPGLAIIAFVDSSFLTLPQAADFLVVMFTLRNPADWWYFGLLTTAGSVAGCYALFLAGRRGGEALLRRRFHERHIDRALGWFGRYGALVLVIPAMLPPPTPFKASVVLAGVSGVTPRQFLAAVAVGRGLRYTGEAWLARTYGPHAMDFAQANAARILPVAAVILVVALAGWWLYRRGARAGGSVE